MPCRGCELGVSVTNRVSARTQLAMSGEEVKSASKVREWARLTVTDAYMSGSVWERRARQVWASEVAAGGVHGQ